MREVLKREIFQKEKSVIISLFVFVLFIISVLLPVEILSTISEIPSNGGIWRLLEFLLIKPIVEELVFRFFIIGLSYWIIIRYWYATKGNIIEDFRNTVIRSFMGTIFPNERESTNYKRKFQSLLLLVNIAFFVIYKTIFFVFDIYLAIMTILLGMVLGIAYLRYGLIQSTILNILSNSLIVFYIYLLPSEFLTLGIIVLSCFFLLVILFFEYGKIRDYQLGYNHSYQRKSIKKFVHSTVFPTKVRRWRSYDRGFRRGVYLLFVGFIPALLLPFIISSSDIFSLDTSYELGELFSIIGIHVTILLAFSVILSTFLDLFKENKYPSFMQQQVLRNTTILDSFLFAIVSIMVIFFDMLFFKTGVFFEYPISLAYILVMIFYFFITSFFLFQRSISEYKRWDDFEEYASGIIKSYTRELAYESWGNKILKQKDLLGSYIPSEKSKDNLICLEPTQAQKLIIDCNLEELLKLQQKDPEFKILYKLGDLYRKDTPIALHANLDSEDIINCKKYIQLGSRLDYEEYLLKMIKEIFEDLYRSYILSDINSIKENYNYFNFILKEILQSANKCKMIGGGIRLIANIQVGLRRITANLESSSIREINDYIYDLSIFCQICLIPYSKGLLDIFFSNCFNLVTKVAKRELTDQEFEDFLLSFSLLLRNKILITSKILIDEKGLTQEEGEEIASLILRYSHYALTHYFESSFDIFSYFRNELYKIFEFLEPQDINEQVIEYLFNLFVLEVGKTFIGKTSRINVINNFISELHSPDVITLVGDFHSGNKRLLSEIDNVLHRIKGTVYLPKEFDFILKGYLVWGGLKGYSDKSKIISELKRAYSKLHPRIFEDLVNNMNKITSGLQDELEIFNIELENLNAFISYHDELKEEFLDLFLNKLLEFKLTKEIEEKLTEKIQKRLEERTFKSIEDRIVVKDPFKVKIAFNVNVEGLDNEFIIDNELENYAHIFFNFFNQRVYNFHKEKIKTGKIVNKTWDAILEEIDTSKETFVIYNGKSIILKIVELGLEYKEHFRILNVIREKNDPILIFYKKDMPILAKIDVKFENPRRDDRKVLVKAVIKSKIQFQKNMKLHVFSEELAD